MCTLVEAWPTELDNGNTPVRHNDCIEGQTYQIGEIGTSAARIVGDGCRVGFMDKDNVQRCELTTGDYKRAQFIPACGEDVITQFKIIKGSPGLKIISWYYNRNKTIPLVIKLLEVFTFL